MRSSTAILGAVAAAALSACATQPPPSYPAGTEARLATYAKATPCCDDPSGFDYGTLPRQGHAQAVVGATTPVFDFQSGLSPFAAYELPDAATPYRIRVKSLFDRKGSGDGGVFYPVVALLDDTFIVVHMTGLESLRLEPALATPGGEPGRAVSVGIDPAEQKGKYLVVFTPAALLGKPPPPEREGDMLSLSSLAYMERRGEAALPASPYGRLRITVAPEASVASAPQPD
ncbi:MAG TPA: MalM family protein [Steroidobacteraceae bacterium]|nr:MalM family protein [Steroidobacteraceae bacterium]